LVRPTSESGNQVKGKGTKGGETKRQRKKRGGKKRKVTVVSVPPPTGARGERKRRGGGWRGKKRSVDPFYREGWGAGKEKEGGEKF